jgi:DNA-binding beta-propeller fold protein YncE
MCIGRFVRYATLLAVAFLAACSGSETTAVAPSVGGAGNDGTLARRNVATQVRTFGTAGLARTRANGGWIVPAKKRRKGVVYVSDDKDNAVEIYPARGKNPAPIGEITSGINVPDGLAVDAKGNLYVADAGSDTVTVYKPGTTTPFETYSPGENPVSVLVGGDGTVYIGQGLNGCLCITEYARGSMTPKLTIPLSGIGDPMAMTLDSKNNLYVSLTNATVYEFAPGDTTGMSLGLSGLHNPRGLVFDPKGDLLVADDPLSLTNGYVDVYPPGETQYSQQITVGPQPFEIAFGRKDAQLYVANVGYSYDGFVEILDAGQGYTEGNMIAQDLHQPLGVALSPGAP